MRLKGSSFRGTQVSVSRMKISNQFAQFQFLSPYHIFLGVLGKVGRHSATESHTQPHTALRMWHHESMTLEPPQNKGQIITMAVYGDLCDGMRTETCVSPSLHAQPELTEMIRAVGTCTGLSRYLRPFPRISYYVFLPSIYSFLIKAGKWGPLLPIP